MKPIRWVGVCAVLVMATGILTIALSICFGTVVQRNNSLEVGWEREAAEVA